MCSKEKRTAGLLLTRPMPHCLENGCSLSKTLRGLGFEIFLNPLMSIHLIDQCIEDVSLIIKPHTEFIFTSQQGILSFSKLFSHYRSHKVWCVGQKTALAAYQAGFTHVIQGKGDARQLLDGISLHHFQTSFIHFSGKDITVDFEKRLPQCQRVILYETLPVQTLRPTVLNALQEGRIKYVFLYSQKTAEILKNLYGLPPHITLFVLSPGIGNIFPGLPFHILSPSHSLEEAVNILKKDHSNSLLIGSTK